MRLWMRVGKEYQVWTALFWIWNVLGEAGQKQQRCGDRATRSVPPLKELDFSVPAKTIKKKRKNNLHGFYKIFLSFFSVSLFFDLSAYPPPPPPPFTTDHILFTCSK